MVLHTSKEEEGPSRGEFWVVARAIAFILCGLLLLSYVLG